MISISRETDKQVIYDVISHDGIFDCIREDGYTDINIDTDATCFLSLKVDGDIGGIFIIEKLSSIEIQFHAQVLPEYRKEYTKKFMTMVYEWIISETGFQKLSASAPSIYPNAANFCKRMGMIEEGINRLSWLKNGEIHDQILLGITREEILLFLGEEYELA